MTDSNEGILSGESGSISWFYSKTCCYKLYLRIYTDKTDVRELCCRKKRLRHDFLMITTRPDDLVCSAGLSVLAALCKLKFGGPCRWPRSNQCQLKHITLNTWRVETEVRTHKLTQVTWYITKYSCTNELTHSDLHASNRGEQIGLQVQTVRSLLGELWAMQTSLSHLNNPVH